MELGDIWWHLATGKWIFEHRGLPSEDPFSLSGFIGRGVLASNWLSQLFLYGVYSLGGVYALIILKAVLFLSVFLVLLLILRGLDPMSYLLLIPFVLMSIHYSEIRPQTISFLFFAITIYILEGGSASTLNGYGYKFPFGRGHCPQVGRGDSPLLAGGTAPKWVGGTSPYWAGGTAPYWAGGTAPLLVIMPLWANIHPGFVSGAVIISIYIIFWLIKKDYKASLIGAFSIVLSLINPNFYKPYLMAISMVGGSAGGEVLIHEHLPIKRFVELTGEVELYWLLIVIVVLGVISFIIPFIKRDKPSVLHFIIFSSLGYLSFITFRAGLFFGIFGAVSIGRNISGITTGKRVKEIARITALIVFILLIVYFFRGTIIKRPPMNERLIPIKTAEFILKEAPPGGVFAPYEWGGYLIWRLYPKHKVFIDGRALGSIREYDIVRDALPGWQEILRKKDINIITFWPVLPYEGTPPGIIIALLRDDSWSPVYWDMQSIVFVRGGLEGKNIDRNALRELIDIYRKGRK